MRTGPSISGLEVGGQEATNQGIWEVSGCWESPGNRYKDEHPERSVDPPTSSL